MNPYKCPSHIIYVINSNCRDCLNALMQRHDEMLGFIKAISEGRVTVGYSYDAEDLLKALETGEYNEPI